MSRRFVSYSDDGLSMATTGRAANIGLGEVSRETRDVLFHKAIQHICKAVQRRFQDGCAPVVASSLVVISSCDS